MKLWPDRLGGRVAIALVLAGLAIFGLDQWVRRAEAARSAPAPALPDLPMEPRVLLCLTMPARQVVLCGSWAVVPAGAAPVVQVAPDGALRLRVPPPLPSGPVARVWDLAAVVLPMTDLGRLSPVQRGAVVEVLGRLLGDRTATAQVRLAAVQGSAEDLAALLRWAR